MSTSYDAIVVGSRCAGSPTAMLLARRGYRVLMVDRSRFPSDTLSSHLLHSPGVSALERWGLRERLEATGCPPIETYSFDFGPIKITGRPRPTSGGTQVGYAPRRTVLDTLLIESAAESGVEVRTGFSVDELLFESGRVVGIRGRAGSSRVEERGTVVIGADGAHSMVAKSVGAATYHDRAPLAATYYSYWENLPCDGLEVYVRPRRSWGAFPTHDGLTVLPLSWPKDEFVANRTDVEGNYLKSLELAPEFAERVRAARRVAPLRGTVVPNYFRKPFGPGWALVGDAGYHKDPCTAQGISDAFRDAELLAGSLDRAWRGHLPFGEAMSAYQSRRDEQVIGIYDLTCQFAALEPPPPQMQELLGAVSADRGSMDDFVSLVAGTVPPAEFFAPDNVARVIDRASVGAV